MIRLGAGLLLLALPAVARPGGAETDLHRGLVAAALRDAGLPVADDVAQGHVTIEPVDARPFSGLRLYRVERFEKSGPTRVHVAVVRRGCGAALSQEAAGGPGPAAALVLSGHPEAFAAAVAAAEIRVHRADAAAGLVRLFHETTRGIAGRTLLVDSFAALPFRPGLDAAETARRRDAQRRLGTRLAPPRARPTAKGFLVTIFVVAGRDLVERRFRVDRRGGIAPAGEQHLDSDLPLVYTR